MEVLKGLYAAEGWIRRKGGKGGELEGRKQDHSPFPRMTSLTAPSFMLTPSHPSPSRPLTQAS